MNPLGLAAAVSLLTLVGLAPWWWARSRATARTARLRRAPAVVAPDPGALVDVTVQLELVAAAVRSGAGLARALDATGRAVGGSDGRALVVVAAGLRLGAPWDAAWAGSGGHARLDPVRDALRQAWQEGAAPGDALRAAAADVRQERRAAVRTAAARLAVRLVLPLGACYLPAFVLLGLTPVLLSLGLDLLSG
ncbi:type II secretion system F family protein [Isoptericola dokdonensis]|jgi:pilus assembly protein TadC|uniref:Bacterial type II secretion system protein F domain protein n=1 Tax=Isoptericola dokdonensis DS-3 TaxID=1300344 RepID=A0A168FEI2_9MICO|nr:type II secretion system F family protein [Isoptericola dokdonensis]ANC31521.1 Bacterial type II secretion system protein F domain protein [Isoptericola dokdonensis DS-3]